MNGITPNPSFESDPTAWVNSFLICSSLMLRSFYFIRQRLGCSTFFVRHTPAFPFGLSKSEFLVPTIGGHSIVVHWPKVFHLLGNTEHLGPWSPSKLPPSFRHDSMHFQPLRRTIKSARYRLTLRSTRTQQHVSFGSFGNLDFSSPSLVRLAAGSG